MSLDRMDSALTYRVVVNHEQQFSIWPANRTPPLGWEDAGKTGSKEDCLEYIRSIVTDMRPLSLRQRMDGAANADPSPQPGDTSAG